MMEDADIHEMLEAEAWEAPMRLDAVEFAVAMGTDWRWTRVAGTEAEVEA